VHAYRDAQMVRNGKQQLVTSAHALLTSALASLSQADVASALQVFFNLGTLRDVVHDTVLAHASTVEKALGSALDARQLTAAASATAVPGARNQSGTTARAQAALWAALDECMNRMHMAAIAMWHLQRVVGKKRDPLTLAAFIDVAQVLLVYACI
jgi:conserved oligomeric Golgi complex subunit 5